MRLECGAAEVAFTPPPGLPLMGNFRDDYAARGTHDPLMARALVVRGAGGAAGVLVLDLCILTAENTAFLRREMARTSAVPPDRVLIAATHTHSGPAPAPLGPLPSSPPRAVRRFLARAATAVGLAERALGPADLRVGRAREARVSFCRRLACRDGRTHMNWEGLDPAFVRRALGKPDDELLVLGARGHDGWRAALINFGLHPAVLAGDNWLYSADYPGYLAEALRRLAGSGLVPIFANGCCGNVNHIDYRDPLQGRGYQMTQRIGHMLAVGAAEALQRAEPVRGAEVAVSRERVRLERLRIPEARRRWAARVAARARARPAKGQVDGLPDACYADMLLDMHARQHEPVTAEVMALRAGDVGLVGLPGEFFCEFGVRIKRASPARHTLVIELANDELGYFPTRRAFREGGYEPTPGTTYFPAGAGERLAASALRQLERLFARNAPAAAARPAGARARDDRR